jgi:hypothetical protein
LLEVKDTEHYGAGVFAMENISQRRVIHVLAGESISIKELIQRINSGTEAPNDPLQIGMRIYIDLDVLSRTFNHSCSPNAGLRKQSELFALRTILKGEQITFDYSTTIAPTLWRMRCRCGSATCRKIIGDVRSIPDEQLSFYRAHGALQNYMKALLKKADWYEIPKFEIAALKAMVKISDDDLSEFVMDTIDDPCT